MVPLSAFHVQRALMSLIQAKAVFSVQQELNHPRIRRSATTVQEANSVSRDRLLVRRAYLCLTTFIQTQLVIRALRAVTAILERLSAMCALLALSEVTVQKDAQLALLECGVALNQLPAIAAHRAQSVVPALLVAHFAGMDSSVQVVLELACLVVAARLLDRESLRVALVHLEPLVKIGPLIARLAPLGLGQMMGQVFAISVQKELT